MVEFYSDGVAYNQLVMYNSFQTFVAFTDRTLRLTSQSISIPLPPLSSGVTSPWDM